LTQELLSCVDVHLAFGHNPALRGVTVAVGAGEILAVTGPSGSGKSTLLLCLSGVITPDRGVVRFAGRPLSADDEASRSALRRSEFGLLFQFGQLIPELSAEENVALPLLLGGSRRRAALSRAREWLERLNVIDQARRRPQQMSGEQAQRVALARAMVTEPAVVFADEPTGSLDSANSTRVVEELAGVVRRHRTTLVLATHDRDLAAWTDRTIQLLDGRVTSSLGDEGDVRPSLPTPPM
jgi:putative ABC transport system ATP-binding protein